MGSANCCKKPDEIVIEEIAGNNDNEYPEDTQQNHRTNPNEQEENMRINATSNQNLYEQDIVSPKIGGAYEVPINVPSPQHNYIQGEGEEAYEQNEMGSPEQYEQNHVEEVNINQNQYEIEDKNINVIENSNNYNMQEGNGSNMVGLDLNSLTNVNASQQGGVDLNNLALRNQQGNIGVTEQQTTTTTTTTTTNGPVDLNNFELGQQSTNPQVSTNSDLNQYFEKATSQYISVNSQVAGNNDANKLIQSKTMAPSLDLKQFSLSTNPQISGNSDMNKYFQQEQTTTKITNNSTNIGNVASVTPNKLNQL